MKKITTLLITMAISLGVSAEKSIEYDALDNKNVLLFMAEMKKDPNFSYSELVDIFSKVKIKKSIKESSKKKNQSEFKLYWDDYKKRLVSENRIKNGVLFLNYNSELFDKVESDYGVPREIIASIIGVESNYGKNIGNFSALNSLSTMAFERNPRNKFFKSQIKSFLIRCKKTKMDCHETKSSWAGAIGYGQFIPTSIDAYAVDYNADGYIDLVGSIEDAVASVAKYLNKNGWKNNGEIVRKVKVLSDKYNDFVSSKLGLNTTVDELLNNGVIDSSDLKKEKIKFFELEANSKYKEQFIGYNNFKVITSYNRSNFYALAIYELSIELGNERKLLIK
jgi:membrane-bound lytic murein transglycosylase B